MAISYLLKNDEGKINVDWEALVKDHREYSHNASDWAMGPSPLEEATDLLLKLDVLTFSTKGTFGISDGFGTHLGISAFGMPVFFTRRTDAEEWDRIKYSDVLYPHEVYRL